MTTANPGSSGRSSHPGASFDLVIEALERYGSTVRLKHGRDAMAQCPCPLHGNGDRNPSLHVWWENGQTSLHCFAGGTGERPHHDVTPVLAPIGLTVADLFDEPLPDRRSSTGALRSFTPRKTRPRSTPTGSSTPATRPSWAVPPPPAPKPQLGTMVSTGHVVSYLYRVHDPDDRGPGYFERVDRHEKTFERGNEKTFKRFHWDGRQWRLGAISSALPKCPCSWHEAHRDQGADLPRPVLFNWPGVQRAIAAGEEVWLVEGEKDALTLIGLGLCATTNVSGAGAWTEAYTASLAGARLVLGLDRDPAGWKRGEHLAAVLYPVARELRVVVPPAQPAEAKPIKDVTDLITAGLPLSDLEQLELGRVIDLASHRRDRDDAGDGGGSGGRRSGSGEWDHIPNTRPTYLQRHGAIVEQSWRKLKGEDEMQPKFAVLIDACAQIQRSTYLDDGTDATPTIHDHVVEVHREDPDTGEIVDPGGTYRIPADEVATGRWPERLPLSNLIVGNKRSERDKAWDALVWVTADELRRRGKSLPTEPIYAVPGWRQTPTGPIYIHGAGAIGAAGHVQVETRLDGEFGGMKLPPPTDDVAELRAAWATGIEPLLELPAKIIAPLLGVTLWASLCGPASHVTHMVGAPGTAKSFAARAVLQIFHPGLLYKSEHQEMMSARNSTAIAMTRSLGRAKDTVLFVDDFAPDDAGGAVTMASKHANFARVVHNRSKRSKAQRLGDGTDNDPAPRGSTITTGELTAAGSAETRCLNIPVSDGDLNGPGVQQRIENERTAAARGLVGASFLCRAAGQLATLQKQVRALTFGEDSYHTVWMERLRDLPHSRGIRSRIADGVATSSAGIRALHDWLVDTGVLDKQQAQQLWDWAIEGLDTVARSQDVEATDPAEHFLAALRAVISSRRGYLADRRGDAPNAEDLDFASAYGWSWQPKPGGRNEYGIAMSPRESGQWMHSGELLGEVAGDKIKLLPESCLGALRAAAARADQRWAYTRVGLSNAMDSKGWLETLTTAAGTKERQLSVSVCGSPKTRAWVMPRALLDGDITDDESPRPTPGPLPHLDPTGAAESTPPGAAEAVHDDRADAPQDPPESAGEGSLTDQTDAEDTVSLTELVERLRSADGDPLDHVDYRSISAGPCQACQQACSLEISGCRVHLNCLLIRIPVSGLTTSVSDSGSDEPVAVAAPTAAAAVMPTDGAAEPAVAPGDHASHAELPRPRPMSGRWKYAAVVLDTDGAAYLPDGHRVGAGAIRDARDVLDTGERLHIGHSGAPGQLWLTEALCEHLGLIADLDHPETLHPDDLRSQTLDRLAEVGQAFLAPAAEAGWRVDFDVLRPVTRLRRAAADGPERVLEILIEPYQWVWDPRQTGIASGEEGKPTALPDIADPAARWSELARRAGRAAELLGVTFRMSAGHVGADLFDVAQRRRRRAAEHGSGIDKAGRNRARVVERAGPMPQLRGQRRGLAVERPFAWAFQVAPQVLAEAEFLHGFDARKQWLPAAKSIELGYCTSEAPNPIHHDDPDKVKGLFAVEPSKLPFGLWHVLLPTWDEPRLPAPHPAQRADQPTRAWVSTPTLRLLLEDPDTRHGAGYTVSQLDPDEAWTWPEQGRLLDGHWYSTLRDALEASKDDEAMEAHIKAVYAGYFGRMASSYTAESKSRPWHHQPVWQQSIIAAARSEEWRKIHRAAWEKNLWPVVVTADEVVYLASGPEAAKPSTVAPAVDNGRVGALRHSRSLQLNAAMKKRARTHLGDLVKSQIWTSLVGSDIAEIAASPAGADPAETETSSSPSDPEQPDGTPHSADHVQVT